MNEEKGREWKENTKKADFWRLRSEGGEAVKKKAGHDGGEERG